MKRRTLGRTEIEITPIVLGTWQAGKNMWVGIDDRETIAAIQAGLDAGINIIDTAEVYGNGHSERIVAQAVGKRRRDVVYATKVFPHNYRAADVKRSCERSLRNLQTDVIDLYQLHWPPGTWGSPKVPIEEPMGAMLRLQERGDIRHIGVSNFDVPLLEETLAIGRIESVQPPFSLLWPHVARPLIPFCVEHDLSLLAYSPLAQGLLTGKFGPDLVLEEGDNRRKNILFQDEIYPVVQDVLDDLRQVAEELETSLTHLALAWLIAQPRTHAITGVRNPQQARDNAAAADLDLSPEMVQRIEDLARPLTDRLDPTQAVMWAFGR